jgi:hypothetical protein
MFVTAARTFTDSARRLCTLPCTARTACLCSIKLPFDARHVRDRKGNPTVTANRTTAAGRWNLALAVLLYVAWLAG